MREDTCQVRKCRREIALTWLTHPVCEYHYLRHCDQKDKFDLKIEFNEEE